MRRNLIAVASRLRIFTLNSNVKRGGELSRTENLQVESERVPVCRRAAVGRLSALKGSCCWAGPGPCWRMAIGPGWVSSENGLVAWRGSGRLQRWVRWADMADTAGGDGRVAAVACYLGQPKHQLLLRPPPKQNEPSRRLLVASWVDFLPGCCWSRSGDARCCCS